MKRFALVLPFMALGLALVGCAGGGSSHSSTTNGPSTGPRPIPIGTRPLVVPVGPAIMRGLRHLHAARFLSPTRLAFPTSGSSNCPSFPDKMVVQNRHAIRVDLVVGSWRRTSSGRRVRVPKLPGGGCVLNLVISPVVIAINPKQIDVHHRLKVSLYYPKLVVRRSKRPVVLIAPPL